MLADSYTVFIFVYTHTQYMYIFNACRDHLAKDTYTTAVHKMAVLTCDDAAGWGADSAMGVDGGPEPGQGRRGQHHHHTISHQVHSQFSC